MTAVNQHRKRPLHETNMLSRIGIMLVMTLLVGAALTFGAIPHASAALTCSADNNNDHCHSQETDNVGHNNGVGGSIYFTCLHNPDSTDFATNEMWEITGGDGTYWIEVGVLDGVGHNNTDYTRTWFWADNIPNGGYFEYEPPGFKEADYSTSYLAKITYLSPQTWSITGGDSTVHMDNADDEPNNSTFQSAGTEFTNQIGLRNSGYISGLAWQDGDGNWWSWGAHGVPSAYNNDQGPNNQIPSSWNPGSHTVSWNDC